MTWPLPLAFGLRGGFRFRPLPRPSPKRMLSSVAGSIHAPRGVNEMPTMPEKDPALWTALLAWVSTVAPQLYAPALSVAVAVLRVIYGGGGSRQMVLEGLLCGLATLSLVPLLEWLGLPSNMATFAGGMVGFVGVEKLREYADRLIGRKVDKA